MKNILNFFLIILIAIQFSCNLNDQEEKQSSAGIATAKKVMPAKKPFADVHFASKKDTTCGMPLTAGIGDTLHLKKKIYGFCSKECREEFVNKLKTERK